MSAPLCSGQPAPETEHTTDLSDGARLGHIDLKTETAKEHRRELEYWHSLSTSRKLSEAVAEHIDTLLNVVEEDEEPNALLAVEIISNVISHEPQGLASRAQALGDRIQTLLRGVGKAATTQQSVPSLEVLSKCPAILMSMLELYPPKTGQQGVALLPLIKSVLQARAQEHAHDDGAATEFISTGVTSHITNKTAFHYDLFVTQVGTLTLLGRLAPVASGVFDYQQLEEIQHLLPDAVIRLLKDCPVGCRKELLVAIRYINLTFCKTFLPVIDQLLDEEILIGNDLTAVRMLKPLGFSVLADLIYLLHDALPPRTVVKVVEIYTNSLQEGTLIKNISVKLLQTMAKYLPERLGPAAARHSWMSILDAIGDALTSLNRDSNGQHYRAVDNAGAPEWDEIIAGPIKVSLSAPLPLATLLTNFMSVIKEILNLLGVSAPDPDTAAALPSGALSDQERLVFLKVADEGAMAFGREFSGANNDPRVFRTMRAAARHDPMTGVEPDQVHLQCAIRTLAASRMDGGQAPPPFWDGLARHIWKTSERCDVRDESMVWGQSQGGDRVNNRTAVRGEDTNFTAGMATQVFSEYLADSSTEASRLDLLRKLCEELERRRKADRLPPECRLAAKQATEQLVIAFAKWLEKEPEVLDPLLGLIDAVANDRLHESPGQLRSVLCGVSAQLLRNIAIRCLDIYASRSEPAKQYLLRNILTPIVVVDVHRQQQGGANIAPIFDRTVIESIRSSIWSPPEDPPRTLCDRTALDTLQLLVWLVAHSPRPLQHAPDILRFSLRYSQWGDPTLRYTAHVLTAYYIAQFDSPADLVSQTYGALLENSPEECRSLVMRALELITPQLGKCAGDEVWAYDLQRALTTRGTTTSHRTTLLQSIARQSELFYRARQQITAPLIDCLYAVAAPSNSPGQSRTLAMHVIRVLQDWDRRSAIPTTSREKIITYLIECVIQQYPGFLMCDRPMPLLFDLLRSWNVPDGAISVTLQVLATDAARGTLAIKKTIPTIQIIYVMLRLQTARCITQIIPRSAVPRWLRRLYRTLHKNGQRGLEDGDSQKVYLLG